MIPSKILRVSCTDRPGLIATISRHIAGCGANIVTLHEEVERTTRSFFTRIEVEGGATKNLEKKLCKDLPEARIAFSPLKSKNIVLFGTRESHCVGDLLLRCHYGDLAANVVAVISNYDTLKDMVERFEIPYFYVPHEGVGRLEHEAKILSILSELSFDYLVLAKYMRILSANFAKKFPVSIQVYNVSFFGIILVSDVKRARLLINYLSIFPTFIAIFPNKVAGGYCFRRCRCARFTCWISIGIIPRGI